jgi:hypothetical protein
MWQTILAGPTAKSLLDVTMGGKAIGAVHDAAAAALVAAAAVEAVAAAAAAAGRVKMVSFSEVSPGTFFHPSNAPAHRPCSSASRSDALMLILARADAT